MQHRILTAWLTAATAVLLVTAASSQCPQNGGWTHRDDSCYKWFNYPNYWFQAEQTCLSHRGHLVSIQSDQENRLVGRLAHCKDVWIGRFGTDLHRLSDPTSYRWTDGSNAMGFERHNFSHLDSVHKPLIRSDGEWWLNSLYHERHPFMCELSANSSLDGSGGRCPNGWSLHNDQCYVMPHFEANFNEANFYCQRNSSHLVSVLTQSELDFVKKLSFGIDGCLTPDRLDSVWIGLIKLNPCFPDSSGRELCYQWTDFSGKLGSIPSWEAGHPDSADWTVNCVTLSDGRLRSDRCYRRHRFVCKTAASNGTDGDVTTSPDRGTTSLPDRGTTTPSTPPPPSDSLVAAFDFRRSLDNLVDPSKFNITDNFGVERTALDGACFKRIRHSFGEFYKVGDPVAFNESIWNAAEWTMYFRLIGKSDHGLEFMDVRDDATPNSLFGNLFAAVLLGSTPYYNIQVRQISPLNSTTSMLRINYHMFNASISENCASNWCDIRLAMKNQVLESPSVRRILRAYYDDNYQAQPLMGAQQLQIGFRFSDVANRLCMRCFGMARRLLSSEEVRQVMSTYCP